MVNVLEVDCAVASSDPWLMTENGSESVVVPVCAARMYSTCAAASLRVFVDFAWTSSCENEADCPVSSSWTAV